MSALMASIVGASRALVVPAAVATFEPLATSVLTGDGRREIVARLQQGDVTDFALLEVGDDLVRVVVCGDVEAVDHRGTVVRVLPASISSLGEADVANGPVTIRAAGRSVMVWTPADRPVAADDALGEPSEGVMDDGAPVSATAPSSAPGVVGRAMADQTPPAPPTGVVDQVTPERTAVEPAGPPPSHRDVTFVRPSRHDDQAVDVDATVQERPSARTEDVQEIEHIELRPGPSPEAVTFGTDDASAPPPMQQPDGATPPADGTGLITSVPGMGAVGRAAATPSSAARSSGRASGVRTTPPPPPPAASLDGSAAVAPPVPGAERGESDGHTVVAGGALRAQVAAARPPGRGADQGLASLVCASGHANPPATPSCRSCGTALGGRALQYLLRPVIARLEFDGGLVAPVDVDKTQVIGRRPTARGDQHGLQPGLVTVPDGDREVSSSHLELRVHDWSLDVVDLRSTNGTWIQPPGGEERRMRPEEPEVVSIGTRLRLGDVASFTVVAPR